MTEVDHAHFFSIDVAHWSVEDEGEAEPRGIGLRLFFWRKRYYMHLRGHGHELRTPLARLTCQWTAIDTGSSHVITVTITVT